AASPRHPSPAEAVCKERRQLDRRINSFVLVFSPIRVHNHPALTRLPMLTHRGHREGLYVRKRERGTMTVLLSESRARCLENRKLLARSRLLIARRRRLLSPSFEISGSSDENLRRTLRTRLAPEPPFPVAGQVV